MVEAYYPETLKEALHIIKQNPAVPYAGGTDIMVKKGHSEPFLFLGGINELNQTEKKGEELILGSCCRFSDLLKEEKVPEVLKQAIRGIAAPAIRNMGTIGGNICNASPAGDTLPVLYAMDARLLLEEEDSVREIPIEQFITGPKKTIRKPSEILTKIIIPLKSYNWTYEKIGARKAQAISKLSFIGLHQAEEGILKDIRIAFGAVGAVIVRQHGIEGRLAGISLKELQVEEIVREYENILSPIDDQRSTARYRKTVCLNLLKEYLTNLKNSVI